MFRISSERDHGGKAMVDGHFAAFTNDADVAGSVADGYDSVGDFAYGSAAAGPRLNLSIYADRPHLRDELRDDAMEAGFRIAAVSGLAGLLDGDARALGDVVLVDCPAVDAAVLAGLTRLDMRAARAGAALVVSTSVDALDDVFGCLDQSRPQILVAPSRSERLIALGQLLARRPGRVCELSDADRLVLMRLTEQVNEIGARLERLKGAGGEAEANVAVEAALLDAPGAFRFSGASVSRERTAILAEAAPALPKARLVRSVIRQRQMRARFFPGDFFADPAWDILLDLAAARVEQAKVSVTSLCIASGVPPTTALRWIVQMTEAGLLRREEDMQDRRRAFIALTENAADGMARFFAALGNEPAPLL